MYAKFCFHVVQQQVTKPGLMVHIMFFGGFEVEMDEKENQENRNSNAPIQKNSKDAYFFNV